MNTDRERKSDRERKPLGLVKNYSMQQIPNDTKTLLKLPKETTNRQQK